MSDYANLLARIAELEAENALLKGMPPAPVSGLAPAEHLNVQQIEAEIEKLHEMVDQAAQA